ncbi:putative membrane protein [Methanonatronarchaeum thermophilum]|uniref:Putative membrane protein n=1 Tax=Methanonatronarchaeum thermophilum TaxID=1927129 RepID=A0A1Y3GC05_9EURY|nr:DUF63 family protein [Methanonatronarchaeum thermophilum]OUJ18949.1 putative membrane protein [Methanonatronarchaeum thermophilum]
MIDRILEFIDNYYIQPIVQDAGYNPVNTITWAILLVIFLFISLKILQKLEIKLDRGFIYSLVPFIFIGSGLRVVEDAGVVHEPLNYLLITPLIYFLVAFITLLVLVVVSFSRKKEFIEGSQNKTVFIVGCILALFLTIYLSYIAVGSQHTRLSIPFEIIVVTLTITGLAYIIARWANYKILLDNMYLLIFGSHIFDASSTFVGIERLGATEKHVLPAYLIELTGTAGVMFPLKILVILTVIWLVDSVFKEGKEEDVELKTLVLLAILVLGLAPAIRNTLRLTLGV